MKTIVFEGVDGSGKTFILKNIQQDLIKQGFRVLVYEDAGFSDLGVSIRPLLLNGSLDEDTRFDLFCAIRRENLKILNRIQESYDYALIDRYILSTLVYNNIYRDMGKTYFEMSRRISLLKPDKMFVIEPNRIEDIQERFDARGEKFDYIAIMDIITDYKKATTFAKSLGYNCDIIKNTNDTTIIHYILKNI